MYCYYFTVEMACRGVTDEGICWLPESISSVQSANNTSLISRTGERSEYFLALSLTSRSKYGKSDQLRPDPRESLLLGFAKVRVTYALLIVRKIQSLNPKEYLCPCSK